MSTRRIIDMAKAAFRRKHHLKGWRKYRGYTQDRVAEMIGISRSYYAQIESGARDYSQDFLEKAAEVLSCDPVDILIRDPSQAEMLWSIYDQLSPVQREQFLEMATPIAQTLKRRA
jgi:transcriptional regulator with XRE-family HTH domain